MKKHLITPALLGLSAFASVAQADSRPNIILINIDDLGWTDLTCQGSSFYETPNIDKLKTESVYFPNGYASAANSAPSRASMLTGCYSARHKVYTVTNSDRGPSNQRKLIPLTTGHTPEAQYTLLPETLQKNGYNTCHVGKWHVGDDPTKQGIDVNIGGYIAGSPKGGYFSPYHNPELPDGPKGEELTDRLTTEALKFLSETRDKAKPFFLYYAPYAVHTPLQTKPELAKKYKAKKGSQAHSNNTYAGMVETMDTNVGRLMDYLKESGLEDNTLVIFTTDNGGVYNISKQWPLRAGKGSFYEGGIRVPTMVKWKGRTKAGSVNETPVFNLDFYPTCLEAAGIQKGNLTLDGESLVPMLDGKASAADERNLYWYFPAYLQGGNSETVDHTFRSRPCSVVRSGDWKLIYSYETETAELFNLKDDISEKKDLASSNPAKRDELLKDLNAWLKSVKATTEFELNPEYQQGGSKSSKKSDGDDSETKGKGKGKSKGKKSAKD